MILFYIGLTLTLFGLVWLLLTCLTHIILFKLFNSYDPYNYEKRLFIFMIIFGVIAFIGLILLIIDSTIGTIQGI